MCHCHVLCHADAELPRPRDRPRRIEDDVPALAGPPALRTRRASARLAAEAPTPLLACCGSPVAGTFEAMFDELPGDGMAASLNALVYSFYGDAGEPFECASDTDVPRRLAEGAVSANNYRSLDTVCQHV